MFTSRSRAAVPSVVTSAPELLSAVPAALDAVGNTTALSALLHGDELDGWGPLITDATTLSLAGITPHAGPAQGSNQATLAVMRLASAEGVNPAALASLRLGGGRPLPPAILARVNAVFGADFSHVRLHQDAAAARMAEAAQARAFTVGSEIWFNTGELDLGTPEGVDLLLHELTHVVQHDEGRLPSSPGLSVSSPSDPHEQEAERVAASLAPAWESASWAEDSELVGDGLMDDAAWASAVDAGPSSVAAEGVVSRGGGDAAATPSPIVKGVRVGIWIDATEAALIGGEEIKPAKGVEGGFASRGEAVAWAGPQLAERGADGGLVMRQGERWFPFTMTVESWVYDFTAKNVTKGIADDKLQADRTAVPGIEGFITQDGVFVVPHASVEIDEGGAPVDGDLGPSDSNLVAPKEADYASIVADAQAGTLPPMDEAGAVALFKGVLKAKALERLRENRAALEAMEAQHAPGAQGADVRWERLRELMAVDKLLAREEDALEAILAGDDVPMPLLLRLVLSNPGMLSAEEIERVTTRLQVIQQIRAKLLVTVPELVSLQSSDVAAPQAALHGEMSAQIGKALAAMEDVSQRILTEDIPLTKLGPVVRDTLAELNITAERATGGDPLSAHVLDWIAGEELVEQVITWGSIGVGITLLIGSLFVGWGWLAVIGLGKGAAVGLALTGSALGVGEAVYGFERADDVKVAADAGGAGAPNALVDDPDAARFQYWMAFFNLVLAGVDVALAARALGIMGRSASGAIKTGASSGKNAGALTSKGLGRLAGESEHVTKEGLETIRQHLSKPEFLDKSGKMFPQNQKMLQRLEQALTNGRPVEGADLSFYMHEITEASLMKSGMPYGEAHELALKTFDVSPYSVYAPEVIVAHPEMFNANWMKFWESQ